jgi:hypothetical protein
MSSTFTAPLRINTRQTTSNDGTISADTTGAARLSQQASFSGVNAAGAITTYGIGALSTTAETIVLPAGSILENVRLFETTAPSVFTGMVITVAVNGTAVGTITPTTSQGVVNMAFSSTSGAVALASNVGTADATISFTVGTTSGVTGTLAGVFTVDYTARNADGSIAPYGSGYTNN